MFCHAVERREEGISGVAAGGGKARQSKKMAVERRIRKPNGKFASVFQRGVSHHRLQ